MTRDPTALTPVGGEEATEGAPPALPDVEAWLTHLVRTLKTCKLYDVNNPTVVRFREDLARELADLIERRGALSLEVTSTQMLCDGATVYAGRSREDNLAATFHRDGIRKVTFLPGIAATELDFFLDKILHVVGLSGGDDDLVTLLWEADLPSITIAAVPLEGDVDGGGEEAGDDPAPVGWPASGGSSAPSAGEGTGGGAGPSDDRSDDWSVIARDGDLDQAFDELESSALQQMARLQQEYEAELAASVVERTLKTIIDCTGTDTTAHDREELGRFLPRLMREAIVIGDWRSASVALERLRACNPEWSPVVFLEGFMAGPSAPLIRRAVAALDAQDGSGVETFLTFGRALGEDAVDWLTMVLAESQQQRTRRPLARAIADLAREHPERLLPWMSDERWYVVRNVVHILGWIGGDDVAVHLKAATQHPEVRVRREVVAALNTASADVSRPILLGMLGAAEPRLFHAILQQLSQMQDPTVSQHLVEIVRDDRFHDRSEDDKRAVFMALAGQGDSVIAVLEEELHRGGLFTHGLEPHWQQVARCLSRIGTPSARAALEAGLRSNKAGIRKACEQALASIPSNHD